MRISGSPAAGALLAAALVFAHLGGAAPARADEEPDAHADAKDPRWQSIGRVFGRDGEASDGYFRVSFPREDLHVSLGGAVLEPGFELTSYFGFVPEHGDRVLAMGEVVLLQEEVTGAVAEASRRGVAVTALHNHMVGETPRILYLHTMAEGSAESVAKALRAVLATTATPLEKEADPSEPGADWSAVDAVLGPHAEAEGATAEYVFPRRESHSVHGIDVRSTGMLETATEVVFQRLGDGRVACGGELFLLPEEVRPAIAALEAAGLHVAALHNHMLDESPTMYWMHWFGTGEGAELARGVAAALGHTNSAPKAEPESE